MHGSARESYMEAQINTATPQKLRLLLIEAALRAGRQARSAWPDHEAAYHAIVRCRDIVSELLAGVRPDGSQLAQRVAALYAFLFKTLTESQLRRDLEKLEEVLTVLEIERETWQDLCQAMPEPPAAGRCTPTAPEISARGLAPVAPPGNAAGESPGAFSIEA